MEIDVTIEYAKTGSSRGSAISVTEEHFLVSNFTVWREASEVYVDFENLEKESSILWNFHSQAKPLIVKKYLRACM